MTVLALRRSPPLHKTWHACGFTHTCDGPVQCRGRGQGRVCRALLSHFLGGGHPLCSSLEPLPAPRQPAPASAFLQACAGGGPPHLSTRLACPGATSVGAWSHRLNWTGGRRAALLRGPVRLHEALEALVASPSTKPSRTGGGCRQARQQETELDLCTLRRKGFNTGHTTLSKTVTEREQKPVWAGLLPTAPGRRCTLWKREPQPCGLPGVTELGHRATLGGGCAGGGSS